MEPGQLRHADNHVDDDEDRGGDPSRDKPHLAGHATTPDLGPAYMADAGPVPWPCEASAADAYIDVVMRLSSMVEKSGQGVASPASSDEAWAVPSLQAIEENAEESPPSVTGRAARDLDDAGVGYEEQRHVLCHEIAAKGDLRLRALDEADRQLVARERVRTRRAEVTGPPDRSSVHEVVR